MIAPQTEEERVRLLSMYLLQMFNAEAEGFTPVARFWRNEAGSLRWEE